MQPLFLAPSVEFEKTAAMTQLSEDPNAWPHEVLQELYKQAPYISDFSPHVVMEKVDGEQGYGLGHVEIGNQTEIQTAATPEAMSAAGLRKVRVPVVIKDGMLAPFDLLVTDDSKVLPLTEPRLRAAIFRPQAFDVTSRTPGDQSMIGQLYPPYRQSYGFGGGGSMTTSMGMGKEGSALESFLTDGLEEVHYESGGIEVHGLIRTKTAGAFQDFGEQFLSPDYLHGVEGSKLDRTEVSRSGKKVASGPAQLGMLGDFVEKNAGAMIQEDALPPEMKALLASENKRQLKAFGRGKLPMQKSSSALGGVHSAVARGAATVGAQATKNTAAAKSHATAAMVRAKNLASKMKKTGSILEAIRHSLYESDLAAFKQALVAPEMQPLLHKNAAAVTGAIQTLLEAPEQPKFASHFAALVQPSVIQLKRVDEGYKVKSASHLFWQPLTQVIDRGEAVSRFGEKIVLAADLEGAVTMADDAEAIEPEHDSDMQGAKPITEAGLYKVQTPEGAEAIGYVIPNLLDIDGTAIPLSLFTNGTQATVQSDVVGVPAEGAPIDLPSSDTPTGRGVFASEGPQGVQATVPLTISGSMNGVEPGEPMTYRAESFTGEQVLVSCQPNLQTVTGTEDGKMLVPMEWQWVPLDGAEEIALESQEDGLGKAASAVTRYPSVEVVSSGGTYSFRGQEVAKLAHDERELLGIDDAMFLLAALGTEQGYGVKKLAAAMPGLAPVRVCIGRSIKLASDEMAAASTRASQILEGLPNLKHRLFKEAAVLGDPQAVDAVLSLGFINPENLTTFVSYLPVLEDSQAKLCDILLASRLGSLIDTPEGSIERAVRSVEAVLEGLKALAFQQN